MSDENLVHLGDKALLYHKVANVIGPISAPTEADERSVVRLVKDSVGHKELRHGFHDLGEGWGIIRLVLR